MSYLQKGRMVDNAYMIACRKIGVEDILGVEERREAVVWMMAVNKLRRENNDKEREYECERE